MNEEKVGARVAEKPKEILLHFLEQYYKAERLYGQSFYALNSKVTIYFRYSKVFQSNYFFGVEADDLARFSPQTTSIFFICGDEKHVIVLPVQHFLDIVSNVPTISNQWKVNISERDGRWFLRVTGKGRFEVSGFLNFYDFTPKDLRRLTGPEVGELIPITRGPKKKEHVVLPTQRDLAQELILSGRDSKQYSVFEKNVTRVLVELGLQAEHLGTPGRTDIIVKEPFRAIIDCKSTSLGALSEINFTRIKRHQQENQARSCAVISERFDPAVVRDAELEGVALIRTQTLAELLHLSFQFPIDPDRVRPLFEAKGLTAEAALKDIRAYVSEMKAKVSQVARVYEVMDFAERTVEEIRGRLAGTGVGEYSFEQLGEALDFLSSPLLDIVHKGKSGFSLKFPPVLAERRIKAVFAGLSHPPTDS